MRLKSLFFILRNFDSLALLSIWTFVAFSQASWGIEPTHHNVEYAVIGERSLQLDVYAPPPSAKAAPTIIWVHGGAWRSGSKSDVPVLHWLTQGFAIASVDYRLSPEARFPAQIHDIKAAIRFLRAHADEHHLDPNQFIIAGSSAGGHLASLMGVSNGVKELEGDVGTHLDVDSNVQAIVSFYGASNLNSILSQSTEHGLSVRVPALQLLLGGQPNDCFELARLASPVTHVEASDPPLWLIHGDSDPQMPLEQSKELRAAYDQYGLHVGLDIVAGGKHGGKEFYEPTRLDQIASELRPN